jgi:hypothetical protein
MSLLLCMSIYCGVLNDAASNAGYVASQMDDQ